MVRTTDFSYGLPLRARIKIYSNNGEDLLFTHDSFNLGAAPFTVLYVDAEHGAGESDNFNIIIEDSQNAIDESLLRNAEVKIEFGKTSSYTNGNFIIGPVRVFKTNRPRTGYQDYLLSGFGDWIRAAELLLLIRQTSKISDLTDKNPKLDSQYNINQQLTDAVTKRKWRPLNREDIQESTHNWETTGISNKNTVNNPVINEVFTSLWDFAQRQGALAGMPVFMDYETGNKVVTMKPLSELNTPIIIKSADARLPGDRAEKISYIKDVISVEDNYSLEAGFANVLYTTTVVDREIVASQGLAGGQLALNNQAIAQQMIISNDSRRIDTLEVNIQKKGDPASPNDRVNFALVQDNNNKPTGNTLDFFSIPLSSIEDSPTKIEAEINASASKLETTGQRKIWFIAFQRSGTTGDPVDDPNNTVLLRHDNKFDQTSPPEPLYSATAPGGDKNRKSKLDWTSTNEGPNFYFKLRSNIRRMQSRHNATSIAQIGRIERYIDTSWMKDPRSVDRFLALVLNQTSKARRTIPGLRVTNPNDFLFRKHRGVTFIDGLSGIEQDLRVLRSRYVISGLGGDQQVGTFNCELTLGGLFNSLLSSCGCS